MLVAAQQAENAFGALLTKLPKTQLRGASPLDSETTEPSLLNTIHNHQSSRSVFVD